MISENRFELDKYRCEVSALTLVFAAALVRLVTCALNTVPLNVPGTSAADLDEDGNPIISPAILDVPVPLHSLTFPSYVYRNPNQYFGARLYHQTGISLVLLESNIDRNRPGVYAEAVGVLQQTQRTWK